MSAKAPPGQYRSRLHQRVPALLLVLAVALLVQQLPRLPGYGQLDAFGLSAVSAPRLSMVSSLALTCVVLVIVAVIASVWLAGKGSRSALLALVWLGTVLFSAGMVLGPAYHALEQRLPVHLEGVDLAVAGQVTGMVSRFDAGRRFRFRIDRCLRALGPKHACPVGRTVRLSWYGRLPATVTGVRAGQYWHLNIRLKRPHGLMNPGGYDAELGAIRQAVNATGYVRRARRAESARTFAAVRMIRQSARSPEAWIASARDTVQMAMHDSLVRVGPDSPQAAGTLVALVTGHQSAIPPATWEIYSRTGTAHLMSISGLHVTMFAALAIWIVRRLLRLRCAPVGLLQRWPAQHIAWALGLLAALGYSLFSGWGIPAQRTCWMLAAAGAVALSGRCCPVWFVMAAAAAVVVVLDPWAPLTAGFWLSFVAVVAILLVAGGASDSARPWGRLRAAVRTQWAASLSLLPLTAVWFGNVSVIGPLANAVAIPVVSIVLTPLAMLGGLFAVLLPPLGNLFLWVASWIGWALLEVLQRLSELPGSVWVTGQPGGWVQLLALVGIVSLLLPVALLPRAAGVACLLPLLFWPSARPVTGDWDLLALDVGQGSSVLVRTARHNLLFDTGPVYRGEYGAGLRVVAPALRHLGVQGLDMLMLSHADADHTGSARQVSKLFNAQRVLGSDRGSSRDTRHLPAMMPCRRGQQWSWDGVQFTVLHPGVEQIAGQAGTSNASSCVLRIESPAGGALLTGDIEKAQERELIRLYGATGLEADVLIAPHHGSGTSSTTAFLDAVRPRWAVFQVGYRNRFRHPAARVLNRYNERGVTALRTDRDGALGFSFNAGRGVTVRKFRDEAPRYWRVPVPGDQSAS